MNATNPHPVDSTTRTCCGGIGRHTLGCIPPPAGAVVVSDWYDDNEPMNAPPPTVAKSGVNRYFRGSSWVIERDNRETDMCLTVDGIQRHDGSADRYVVLDDDAMTPGQARQLAAALLMAADEIDPVR